MSFFMFFLPCCFVSSTKLAWKIFESGAKRGYEPQRRGEHRGVGYWFSRKLSQTTRDPVCDWMDHVIVDLVSDFLGEMRRPPRHAFAGKCGCALGAEKHRAHGSREERKVSFHLLSLLFI